MTNVPSRRAIWHGTTWPIVRHDSPSIAPQGVHDMDMDRVLAQTLLDGGGTYDAATLEPIVNGPWAVGGSIPGRVIPMRGVIRTVDLDDAFTRAFVSLQEDGAVTIGTWVDEGMLYIDAVDLIVDTDEAIALAAERGELAIYHLTDKVTLEVSR